jgi:5-methylcytosine-specific restriction protein B
MAGEIEFVVNGKPIALTRAAVSKAMRGVAAEPVKTHTVLVDGTRYPVKQVLGNATGLDRLDFTSATARRILTKLGFEVSRS